MLVNPEMAALVVEEGGETPEDLEPSTDDTGPGTDKSTTIVDSRTPPPALHGPTRIVASKTTANDVSLDDVSQLREEIIRTLRDGRGTVTVTITIAADKADGFSESTTRAVRENSVQLGLKFKELD